MSIVCKIEGTTGDNGNNKTGNETMLNQTIAADKIIKNCERSLKASCVSCPDTMMECILDTAQEYVNDGGYRWDVALAKACKIYPATRYAAEYIYGPLS